jgi:signal transduction histidine kinase
MIYIIAAAIILLSVETGLIIYVNSVEEQQNLIKIEDSLETIKIFTLENLDNNIQNIKYALQRTGSITDNYGYKITDNLYQNNIAWINHPLKSIIPLFLWIPYLGKNDVQDFNSFIKTQNSHYEITTFNGTSLFPIKNYTQSIYTPITYTSPILTGNLSTIYGFDLNSIPLTKKYIDDILFNNNNNFTFSNRSINLTKDLYGVVLSLKSCRIHPCSESSLIGFHMLVINTKNLVLQSLPKFVKDSDVYLRINNVLKNNTLEILYKDNTTTTFSKSFIQIMSQRKWDINIYFKDSFIEENYPQNSKIILIVSVLGIIIFNIILITSFIIVQLTKLKNNETTLKYNLASHMLGYVNHEIRNPLNAIIGLIDITETKLKEYTTKIKDVEPIISNLNTANQSCIFLLHIVNDILDIRKIEQGKFKMNSTEFKLSTVVNEVTKMIASRLQEKQSIKFTTNYTDTIIYTDKTRLAQILLNFIVNSIKYTNLGFIELKILEFEDYFKFCVSDSGVGITDENKGKIFTPFEQVGDNSSRYGGIGFGLYLCKMLIDRMNGTIGFESVRDVGSTFWITIKKLKINKDKVINV